MNPDETNGSADLRANRLDGWGQIASYLGTSTKTAMRWEEQEKMPIHRHVHNTRVSVFAFQAELDAWRALREPAGLQTFQPPDWPSPQSETTPLSSLPKGCPPPVSAGLFLGREDALRTVTTFLTAAGMDSRPFRQLLVTGVPGVGKTTLASHLSRSPEIGRAYPDGVLWTCLDRTPMLVSLVAVWGRVLGIDLIRVATIQDATAAMRTALKDKRMLLMVDDVWDEGHGAVFQQMLVEGCGLLVTTRLPRVADALAYSTEDVYLLRQLDESNAVRLLSLLAPQVSHAYPAECRELVMDLECLPLAIQVAGRLLRKRSARGLDVRSLLESIRSGSGIIQATAPPDRVVDGTVPTVQALLHKSTDMLDTHSRQCFAQLAAFAPKPAAFDLEAMKHVCDVPDATQLADELVDFGLLEPTGDGRFQMHALLVAHAQALAAAD